MQTVIKVVAIVGLAVALALGLYILVDSQFSMSFGPGGMSPGFAWLLSVRANENGGQIAPSFDEINASRGGEGGMPPFLGGAESASMGGGSVPLTDGFEPAKAPARAAHDLLRIAVAIALAVALEWLVVMLTKRRPRPA